MALTDTAIRNAKPSVKPVKMFDASGLYLLVQPAGGKLWRLKFYFGGKEKLLALGSYPEITLRDARARRDEARRQIAHGIDPGQARKAAKAAQRIAAENSFEAVARAWWAAWSSTRSAKHVAEVMRRLEADVFPEIGTLPISSITAPQILAVSLKIEKRGALDLAKRAYQTCGQVLRYAVANGLSDRNAAADVKPSDALRPTRKENYARLDVTEVPELLRRIDVYDGAVYTRLALRLMALTFVRTSELIGARWDEIDLEAAEWRIPAKRMKMETPQIVPLAKQAIEVLNELLKLRQGRDLVFPGERDHGKPMSNNTILFALYRMGYHSRMTGHGFHGIASTILHELGHRRRKPTSRRTVAR